jgi:uncharacterized protein YkwD
MAHFAAAIVAVLLAASTVSGRQQVGALGIFHKHRAAAQARPSANCNVGREQRARDVEWMLGDINRLRSQAHAPPLAFDARLCTVAVRFADDLIARHTIGHVSSNGQSPFDRMRAAGIALRNAAENVARAGDVIAGNRLLSSDPPHRRNMLDGTFRHVGLAAVRDANGDIVMVQDFTD